MRPGFFLVGILVLAGLAALVLGLLWRSPPPSAEQPAPRPLQERSTQPPAPAQP